MYDLCTHASYIFVRISFRHLKKNQVDIEPERIDKIHWWYQYKIEMKYSTSGLSTINRLIDPIDDRLNDPD